jgi:hypothetical protein
MMMTVIASLIQKEGFFSILLIVELKSMKTTDITNFACLNCLLIAHSPFNKSH